MQDKILLGFLSLYGSMTSYDAKKYMEKSTSLFYNASLGSINPAFQKLLAEKAVTAKQISEKNRIKKIYSITERGRKIFAHWMEENIEEQRIKSEALLKIFFFSTIEGETRERLLENYIRQIDANIEGLTELTRSEGLRNCTPFERDTLSFGIDYYRFLHGWFMKYKTRIKRKERARSITHLSTNGQD